jgi:hypothetical protein
MIKYFIHLSNPICTGLVAEAFEASRKLHLENKRSWYRNITEVIDYFEFPKHIGLLVKIVANASLNNLYVLSLLPHELCFLSLNSSLFQVFLYFIQRHWNKI